MTPKPDDAFDVFLSFAAPDEARVRVLAEQLDLLGVSYFFSAESIQPGQIWDVVIPDALKTAQVAVILLSHHTEQAHYQLSEIGKAIELARKDKVTLIPVHFDGMPAEEANWEFGLRRFNNLDWSRLGPEETARQIATVLDDLRHQAASPQDNAGEVFRTYGEIFHNAALKIDRTDQWLPILEACAARDNALFLVHGPRQQNLDLFVSRLWFYLAGECNHHHRPFVVPLQVEYSIPRSAAAWENHLKLGLASGTDKEGTAEDLLRDAARAYPVFLVLSRLPIASSGSADDFGVLDEAEVDALEDFLGDRLPRLIASASAGAHPIRALLASHYSSEGDSLVKRLDAKAYAGCRAHGLTYRKLPPLRPLTWTDIEYFLANLTNRPPERVIERLKAAFEELDRDDDEMEFRDIINLLSKLLH